VKTTEKTISLLNALSLRGAGSEIDVHLSIAEEQKISYLGFLTKLLESEIEYRRKRKLARNTTGAHFPTVKSISDFQFGKVKGITKSQVSNLVDSRWIDKKENLLFFGPPGIGKTHLAVSLGVNALEQGYTVCFERMTNLIRILKTAHIQRTSEYRLRRIQKSSLLIIDEIGYTPVDRSEANLFFSLISDLYERTSIIITSNKNFEQWAEMLGDEVMTTALLDRLLHHSQTFSMNGESFRLK
jgi:DNA replication protein DnaC